MPGVLAEVTWRGLVEQHLLPLVACQCRDRARDGEPIGCVRIRGVEDPSPGLFGHHLHERREVRRRRGVVRTGATGCQQHDGPPVQGALDEVPLARYETPLPWPWIFDGRSTVTGNPLSSSTCSAATLFAPYPSREL